jgi:hypothetical protein
MVVASPVSLWLAGLSLELSKARPSVSRSALGGRLPVQAYWRRRVVRLAACRLGMVLPSLWGPAGFVGLAADAAFWSGVRSAATGAEWERFARSSYVVFYYHRIGERGQPGEERLDVHPRRFERQLGLLRFLRFRPLSPNELLTFHTDPTATLPRGSYVVTADDGFRDAVEELRRRARLRPHVFVNTSCVGGTATWAYREPLASWQELQELQAAGGVIGSHCRHHPRLTDLELDELEDEMRSRPPAAHLHAILRR